MKSTGLMLAKSFNIITHSPELLFVVVLSHLKFKWNGLKVIGPWGTSARYNFGALILPSFTITERRRQQQQQQTWHLAVVCSLCIKIPDSNSGCFVPSFSPLIFLTLSCQNLFRLWWFPKWITLANLTAVSGCKWEKWKNRWQRGCFFLKNHPTH